jgi:predicted nucleotidyltransferase
MKISVYNEEIKQLCERLLKRFQPDCIILHGSVARKMNSPKSDVDILVIGNKLDENFFTRCSN